MKQIPNLFTLINLLFGCIAIVLVLQTMDTIVVLDNFGVTQVVLPERIWQGALFIFGAALIDFLDGFVARILKAQSEMGSQLDSLSDVVSFGVAPGMILYQLLRMAYAQEAGGLDVTVIALLPAFIFTCAAAWRLARFNVSTDQSHSFRGVPTPAAGLLIASFPLILLYGADEIRQIFINKWLLYGVILLVSYLMVSNHRLMSLKFRDYSLRNNAVMYALLVLSALAIIFLRWLSVPVIFIMYVLFSFFSRDQTLEKKKEMVDVTV